MIAPRASRVAGRHEGRPPVVVRLAVGMVVGGLVVLAGYGLVNNLIFVVGMWSR